MRRNANHPWKRVQTKWAFPAWAKQNPELKRAIEERYRKNLKSAG
jgi:hypothetical protein